MSPATLANDGRDGAHSPAQLVKQLLRDEDAAWADAFRQGLETLAEAQATAFPENIFGDLDYPAACVLDQGRRAGSVELVRELFERMADLQHLYGKDTAIRFRYVHDFTYGYDWAKWVKREPTQDGSVGPFDLEFLVYMRKRGEELLELIARDDRKYPSLRDERHRNPFEFSREPDAERRLFGELARRGWLPVEAWRSDAQPTWERDFAALRVRCAGELGLLIDGAA